MPEQPPPDCSGICWHMYCVIFQWPRSRTSSWRRRPGCVSPPSVGRHRPRSPHSCHHLGEHLLGGELVPVGAARVLADGGDKLVELVVASDPELNPAGAAADVPG